MRKAQSAAPPPPGAGPAAGARGPAAEAWQAETRGRIEAALLLPRGARALAAGGGGARVGIAFEVGADGRLLSVAVVAPSGQPALDAAAVAAVRAASPFAPPPSGRTTTAQFTINLGR
ncbi:MAG: energy transducer TonB family protein [Gemmobacter sp.]